MVGARESLANQSHEVFLETLRPKVDGTRFLDEIFMDNDLDFFMCFSSLASVSGNMGQTAYAAANAARCASFRKLVGRRKICMSRSRREVG